MGLTHFNEAGHPKMVSVDDKKDSLRVAKARGRISLSPAAFEAVIKGNAKKGDVLSTAQVAGVMGAKKTSDVIPMCHPLLLTGVDIDYDFDEDKKQITVYATVKTFGKTGVEMEAMVAVSATLLTIYDMVKAIDKTMVIEEIVLVAKDGGKSGSFRRDV